jgi:hypothetical protein
MVVASMNSNLPDKIFLSSAAEAQKKAYEHARRKSTVRMELDAGYSNDRGKQPKKKITQTR